MIELLRVGAIARPVGEDGEQTEVRKLKDAVRDSPPEREEVDAIVAEHERGLWRPVRLDLFADVLSEDGRVDRVDSIRVEGIWFKVPHSADNVRHAHEAADQSFDRLDAHLREQGYEIPTEQLESVPFVLELDDQLEAELGGPAPR